jgi:membrane-bound lytic murein transglycosylase D
VPSKLESVLRKARGRALSIALGVLCVAPASAWAQIDYSTVEFGTETFPCPPSLRARTEFWLRIFTQYTRNDKVIHDASYPWVIYEVYDVTGLSPRAASDRVDQRLEYYGHLLDRLAQKSPDTYTPAEQSVARLLADVPEGARYTRASDRLRVQTGVAVSTRAGMQRAGRYLPHIQEVLRRYELPEEIAYLPCVESSYNPDAYSKVGAAGLWQFTRDTGRKYMRVEADLDERRDPYRATEAAAQYLGNSYLQLGSWPLSVVSYNHGLNGVLRARNQLGTNDIARILHEYDGPSFGFASQNFYCEFLAAIEIGRNPERYFPDLQVDEPHAFVEYALPEYVKLGPLTEAFRIPRDQIALLNPALGESFLNDSRALPRGYLVRLPAHVEAPDALYAMIPNHERFEFEPAPPGYRVVPGDTLSRIAKAHRVSLGQLCEVNGIGPKDRIFPGQVLLIP